jgi:hypothetical protein
LSLQALDLEDLCSKISLDREVDPEAEQSVGNEASIVAVISRNSKTLGSSIWRRQATQLGRLGGEARAIASP